MQIILYSLHFVLFAEFFLWVSSTAKWAVDIAPYIAAIQCDCIPTGVLKRTHQLPSFLVLCRHVMRWMWTSSWQTRPGRVLHVAVHETLSTICTEFNSIVTIHENMSIFYSDTYKNTTTQFLIHPPLPLQYEFLIGRHAVMQSHRTSGVGITVCQHIPICTATFAN